MTVSKMKREFQGLHFTDGYALPAKRYKGAYISGSFSDLEPGMARDEQLVLESQLKALANEDGPLGLKLRKTPSLLDLVQISLSSQKRKQLTFASASGHTDIPSCSQDKKKATNFSAALLRIGDWEYASRYECDLVVKCYFAKRKLVWEILRDGLKSKIEVQWSDIAGLQSTFPDNNPSLLEIELLRPPMFYKESNPEPRKHTIWQATSDFTGGQATIYRRHVLQFPYGTFEKHYLNLLQADERLRKLSAKPLGQGKSLSPYFSSGLAPFSLQRQQQYYLSLIKDLHFSHLNSKLTGKPHFELPPLQEPEEDAYAPPSELMTSGPPQYCGSHENQVGGGGEFAVESETDILDISDYLIEDQSTSWMIRHNDQYHSQFNADALHPLNL